MLKLRDPVRIWRRRQASLAAALVIAVLGAVLGAAVPAAAFNLFGGRSVDVQFATPDGKPMADAEVRVYSPGNPGRVALTGRTDKDGKFSFETDRDGLWTAEARDGTEIARASVRVGNAETGGDTGGPSPYLLLGLLVLLLAIAVFYRYLRARTRRKQRPR